jgi:Outer membrane lipoprotein LolB
MGKRASLLLLLACIASCRAHRPVLAPTTGPQFRSLSITFKFHDGSERQNGRVHWRFDENASKFLFFTPLNQVGLELDVAGEEAVLVNFSKKAFWRGDFSLLLDRLWGIGLPLAELRSLLDAGLVPRDGFAEQGIAATIERDPESGAPQTVLLRRGSSNLMLRITRSELRPGRIILIEYAKRYREADLEHVLEE